MGQKNHFQLGRFRFLHRPNGLLNFSLEVVKQRLIALLNMVIDVFPGLGCRGLEYSERVESFLLHSRMFRRMCVPYPHAMSDTVLT